MPIATRIRYARAAVADQLAARRAHRELNAELAAFRTPAERAELHELISRHSAAETAEVRRILDSHDRRRRHDAAVLGRYR